MIIDKGEGILLGEQDTVIKFPTTLHIEPDGFKKYINVDDWIPALPALGGCDGITPDDRFQIRCSTDNSSGNRRSYSAWIAGTVFSITPGDLLPRCPDSQRRLTRQ